MSLANSLKALSEGCSVKLPVINDHGCLVNLERRYIFAIGSNDVSITFSS